MEGQRSVHQSMKNRDQFINQYGWRTEISSTINGWRTEISSSIKGWSTEISSRINRWRSEKISAFRGWRTEITAVPEICSTNRITVKLVYKDHPICGPHTQVVFICRFNSMESIHLGTCKMWFLSYKNHSNTRMMKERSLQCPEGDFLGITMISTAPKGPRTGHCSTHRITDRASWSTQRMINWDMYLQLTEDEGQKSLHVQDVNYRFITCFIRWRIIITFLYSYSKYNFTTLQHCNIISFSISHKLRHFITIKPRRVSNLAPDAPWGHICYAARHSNRSATEQGHYGLYPC